MRQEEKVTWQIITCATYIIFSVANQFLLQVILFPWQVVTCATGNCSHSKINAFANNFFLDSKINAFANNFFLVAIHQIIDHIYI